MYWWLRGDDIDSFKPEDGCGHLVVCNSDCICCDTWIALQCVLLRGPGLHGMKTVGFEYQCKGLHQPWLGAAVMVSSIA